jgi:hypothetical protein
MATESELSTLPQGDLRLLDDPTAQALLASTELARLAYAAGDGTPRVIPVGWLWTRGRFVFGTFARSPKIAALRRRPAVAVTIDRAGPPPESLLVRGTADVEEVEGVPDEYGEIQAKFYGEESARSAVTGLTAAGAQMARVTITPSWVGVFDFQRRVPGALADLAG